MIICPNCGEDNSYEQLTCTICKSNLLLNNRYTLIKILGENIGITYLAVDKSIDKKVVIKELSIKAIEKWKTEELFKREAEVLKSLSHKNIPDFIEQFIDNTSYYLVMEYIDGISLYKELDIKRYNEQDIYKLVKDITQILQYLHGLKTPIIHRDIKLSNIIRDIYGDINLIDFGGVKHFINSNRGSTIMGTVGYAAPEQLTGRSVIQSDFYSLGMVALVLLTRKDISAFIDKFSLDSVEYESLSNKMIVLIKKLTSKAIIERFQSTEEILDFLKEKDEKFNNINREENDNSISFFTKIKRLFIPNYEVDSKNSFKISYKKSRKINIYKLICPYCLTENNRKETRCLKCNESLFLNNKYKIIKILGKNIGITYLAYKNRKDIVVIKELSIKKIRDWKNEELFKRERVALSNLKNKRIPKIIDTFEKRTGKKITYYTVIQHINGIGLDKIIKDKKIQEKEVINFLKEFSKILDYIHSLTPAMIHRDIKPSNIIVRKKDYYLIDFNSITDILKEEGGSTITGTFGYMAPEQFYGKAGRATDYYALGVLSIEMLTGLLPKDFISENEINWDILDISSKMKYILYELLEYNYEARIDTREKLLKVINRNIIENKKDISVDKIIRKNKKVNRKRRFVHTTKKKRNKLKKKREKFKKR